MNIVYKMALPCHDESCFMEAVKNRSKTFEVIKTPKPQKKPLAYLGLGIRTSALVTLLFCTPDLFFSPIQAEEIGNKSQINKTDIAKIPQSVKSSEIGKFLSLLSADRKLTGKVKELLIKELDARSEFKFNNSQTKVSPDGHEIVDKISSLQKDRFIPKDMEVIYKSKGNYNKWVLVLNDTHQLAGMKGEAMRLANQSNAANARVMVYLLDSEDMQPSSVIQETVSPRAVDAEDRAMMSELVNQDKLKLKQHGLERYARQTVINRLLSGEEEALPADYLLGGLCDEEDLNLLVAGEVPSAYAKAIPSSLFSSVLAGDKVSARHILTNVIHNAVYDEDNDTINLRLLLLIKNEIVSQAQELNADIGSTMLRFGDQLVKFPILVKKKDFEYPENMKFDLHTKSKLIRDAAFADVVKAYTKNGSYSIQHLGAEHALLTRKEKKVSELIENYENRGVGVVCLSPLSWSQLKSFYGPRARMFKAGLLQRQ